MSQTFVFASQVWNFQYLFSQSKRSLFGICFLIYLCVCQADTILVLSESNDTFSGDEKFMLQKSSFSCFSGHIIIIYSIVGSAKDSSKDELFNLFRDRLQANQNLILFVQMNLIFIFPQILGEFS